MPWRIRAGTATSQRVGQFLITLTDPCGDRGCSLEIARSRPPANAG